MLDKNNIATEAGEVEVYNYDMVTREYTDSSTEYLAVGVGIPANSAIDQPPVKKKGYAVLRKLDDSGWELVADHRGETVYCTETGTEVAVTNPGGYPENTTTLAPATPCDKWNGIKWITDADAKYASDIAAAEQKKAQLRAVADDEIAWREDAVEADIATDDEKATLTAWKKYRVLLMRVAPSKPEWPPLP
ncbi:TPA: tail fiber assembly protein [Enterobacter cloacae]|uniref:tail fiber assembly protein n=1 Tax=Enterobacter cloacae TaxID=550 RepID=UPI001F356F2B|nr:tail fiber assembly protein [Enterobacter cloacae]HBN1087996.1 tail fiber assembly protein [Enterobacter cloacae]